MSSVFLFDIDNTLLNTKKLTRKYIYPELSKYLRRAETDLMAVRDQYYATIAKPSAYDPDALLAMLADRFQAPIDELKRIFFRADFFVNSIFDDVLPTLDRLIQREYTLGIFSEGVRAYQLHKLRLSELAPYFDPDLLFITEDKVAATYVQQLPTDSVVVDDTAKVITTLRDYEQLTPVWLNRGESTGAQELTYIHTLSDIFEVI